MGIEIGDPFLGIEMHRLFEVAHRPVHRRPGAKGQAPRIATPCRCSYTSAMTIKVALLLAAAMLISAPASAQTIDPKVQARIDRILKATPLIDGHNDLAEQLREHYGLSIEGLASGTDKREHPLMTDMARLHQGRVGGQFWSVYIPSEVPR